MFNNNLIHWLSDKMETITSSVDENEFEDDYDDNLDDFDNEID